MTFRENSTLKIYQGIFDDCTMKTLVKLAGKRHFDSIDYPISTGKEADVYRATKSGVEFLAIKIYRIETSNFKAMQNYLIGDIRFDKTKSSKRSIVETWCKKEYRNLCEAMDAGVKVPYPIKAEKNVLIMGFVGNKEGVPYPLLKNVKPKNPEKLIKILTKYVEKLWKNGLVHGDLNEYNIIMEKDVPIVIDIGQAMQTRHPIALELLQRDLRSIEKLARKYNIKFNHENEMKRIIKIKPKEIKKIVEEMKL